jgi:hypothetical protein
MPSALLIALLVQVGGLAHTQLSTAHTLMAKLVKRACRANRLMDYRASRQAAEDAAAVIWQCWAVGVACGCGLGAALLTNDTQPLFAVAGLAALLALAVLLVMTLIIGRDPASPFPAWVRKCTGCCCCCCARRKKSSRAGYSAIARIDLDDKSCAQQQHGPTGLASTLPIPVLLVFALLDISSPWIVVVVDATGEMVPPYTVIRSSWTAHHQQRPSGARRDGSRRS